MSNTNMFLIGLIGFIVGFFIVGPIIKHLFGG